MKTTTIALIMSLFAFGVVSAQESADWRKVADAVQLGSRVKIQKTDGKQITGTLMRVDSNEMLVKRHSRRPEPAVAVPFDQVGKIERSKEGGFSVGKAIAIGAGAGAGAMLTLILFALQLD
jgi:small nuclear ribonucleoprotein (snRNP)-like protein